MMSSISCLYRGGYIVPRFLQVAVLTKVLSSEQLVRGVSAEPVVAILCHSYSGVSVLIREVSAESVVRGTLPANAS